MDRRKFLTQTMGAAFLASLPADDVAPRASQAGASSWDRGQVKHLLPTVSDSRMLIKASFVKPLAAAPRLRIGTATTTGVMTDTKGECWQFYADSLQADRRYTLSLADASGQALCQPWDLSTFPAPGAPRDRMRILFFTCAGGPDSVSLTGGYLPTGVRNRLLRRGLSFLPDVAVANGDHVYWDLHARGGGPVAAERLASFPRSALVFGDTNETILKLAAGPQILPVYGTDFRSTPVFFLQDDHDYFDNDEGTDAIVTFPPPWIQLQLARATQRMYYPEFLPDASRPAGLPWSSSGDRAEGLSETFGTLRFGSLVEILLYDVRRTMTLAGPSAVVVDAEAERWLHARTAATDVTHVVHAPSNPPGWSAGKWGEWYPDVLGADGRITTATAKPYWQAGWLAQHDRLMRSLSSRKGSIPLVVSGDLHAVAAGTIERSGVIDLRANPVTTVVAGPIGTAPGGWPSAFRGTPPVPPAHLDLREAIKPIEQHGFTIADFSPDTITLRFFKWDVKTERPEAIDHLEPFHTMELGK